MKTARDWCELVTVGRSDVATPIVALASPSDSPPPGRYGYYSDGAQQIAAVAVTPSGKRLYEEVNGDTLSSNVAPYVESMDFDYITVGD